MDELRAAAPDSRVASADALGPPVPLETRRVSRRFAIGFLMPVIAVLVIAMWPLVAGSKTLFLRDVFNTHWPMKHAEVEALREGRIPLVDPYRAGGQPLLGNPNSVPLYPDNVLFLAAPELWAFNAHFWIHLLLAPFSMAWLGRRLGLRRGAAWTAGVVFATSGFVLSNLSFYNLIAGTVLAPAFVAACLEATGDRVRRGVIAGAALWALLLLGGEPLLAVIAALLAAGAVLASGCPRPSAAARLGLLFTVGTLIAAPQWVELLRILPLSFRGHFGFSGPSGTVESFDPRQILDWLLPQPFGRLDLIDRGAFWGDRFYTGFPPYYPSLYPGLFFFGLLAAAGRAWRSRAGLWACLAVAAGLFLALGRFNPLASPLFGAGLLRYPIKFWLPVAIGSAYLCGRGYERAIELGERAARTRLLRVLGLLGCALAALWLWLVAWPGATGSLRNLIPAAFRDDFVANERLRWAGLCLLSLAALAALAVALRWVRSRPAAGGLLLALYAATQLFLLAPLFPMDDVEAYRRRPELLDAVPQDVPVVHGGFLGLFGKAQLVDGDFPRPELRFAERRAYAELQPVGGIAFGRHYEANCSPEGLDAFLARAAQAAIVRADDPHRIRLLRAWGVGRLILERPLEAAATEVRLVRVVSSYGRDRFVYAVEGYAPAVYLATHILRAPDLAHAATALGGTDFDAGRSVVLPGEGPARTLAAGTATVVAIEPEAITADVESTEGGYLVVQRTHLPLYRATIDGSPVTMEFANLYRIGVEVPAGHHRVLIATDRRPLHAAFGLSALGVLLLLLVPRMLRGAPSRTAAP